MKTSLIGPIAILLGATFCQDTMSATPRQPFQPTLTTNEEPEICARFLDAYRADFLSNDPEIRLSRLHEGGADTDTGTDYDGDGHADQLVFTINMTRGSHEGYAVWALPADIAIPEFPDIDLFGEGESSQAVSPEARTAMRRAPRVYPAMQGASADRVDWRYLPAQIVRIQSHWYSIERSQWSGEDAYEPVTVFAIRPGYQMEPVCTVVLRDAQGRSPELALESAPTQQLQALLDVMSGSEGNCGSGSFLTKRINARKRAERRALLRPWVIEATSSPKFGELLSHWKYDSPGNMNVANQIPRALRDAQNRLKSSFIREFGLPANEATKLARRAAANLIHSGFGTPAFTSEPSLQLRRKFLDVVLSKNRIRQRDLEFLTMSSDGALTTQNLRWPDTMHFAVWNPRVINDLAELSFDVNGANGFGKTALMYAAQENNTHAIRALLRSGADVHKATTRTNWDCDYLIRRQQVTALHYAIRYGSKRTIEVLLEAGASPVAADSEGKTAQDWLDRYASENPNLDTADVRRIQVRLQRIVDRTHRHAD